MAFTISRRLVHRLSLALLTMLPLLASAQTIKGFSTYTPQPEKASKYRTATQPVAGQYIVVLKPSAARLATDTGEKLPSVAKLADGMAATYGFNVRHIYDYVLRGFAIQASDSALNQLLTDARVEYVEQDSKIVAQGSQLGATWGLDRSDQRDLPLDRTYNYDSTAANVHAYVIDSGLRATHSEFAGRVGNSFSAINGLPATEDCAGHGTHVAGTLGGTTWGVAKGVILHPVRIFACDLMNGNLSDALRGINWVAANHIKPAVANMSFVRAGTSSLDSAVSSLIATGVTVVAAAGNSSSNACLFSPARVPAVLTVGATDRTDRRWIYDEGASNAGSCVDLFAPGSGILSASFASDSDGVVDSGTSMAAPHVAGAAALYLSASPNATPAQVATAIINNATPGKVTFIGTDTPNRLLYIPNTPPPNIALRNGLSGAWYNPETNGQGFMIEFDALRNLSFGGWYTFDTNGQADSGPGAQRWYVMQENFMPGDTRKTMKLYRNVGGNFDAEPRTDAVHVGNVTLSFQSCTTGRLDYDIFGDGEPRNGTIPLTRLDTNPNCAGGGEPTYSLSQDGINPSLSGAWYEPRTSGQGFQFLFQPASNNLAFMAWFTYSVNGQNAPGASGQRWYTIQGQYTPGVRSTTLYIYRTTGGRFDTSPPTTSFVIVGTATVVFHTCDTASLTYTIDGVGTRTIPLYRLSGGGNCRP